MTTTNIGALSVEITADSSGLKKGIKGAQDDLVKGRKAINENAAEFAKWGAAGVAAATAIGAAVFKMTADNVRELKNLSFAANELVEDFQRGAFAADQFGISQEKYGDILKDVNDRVGDFLASGGGPMADFFENIAPKVGITAEAFRGLSGQEAMGLFVKSLEEANVSQQEMTFYMEAMASDATQLIPLFKDNAAALKDLTAQAEALGIGLSSIEVEQIEQASKAIDAAGASTDALIQDLVAEFAPVVTAIAESFGDAAQAAGGMGDEISLVKDIVVNSMGLAMDSVEGVKRVFQVLGRTVTAVVLGIQEGMLTVADAIVNKPVEAVNELIDALNTLPWHNIEPVELSNMGETIKAELGVIRRAVELNVNDIQDILTAPMPSEGLKSAIEEASKQAEELAKIRQAARLAEQEEADQARIAGIAVDYVTSDIEAQAMKEAQAVIDAQKKAKEAIEQAKIADAAVDFALEDSPELKAKKAETQAILDEITRRNQSEQELMNEKFIAENEALAEARELGLINESEHLDKVAQINQDYQNRMDEMKRVSREAELAATSDLFGALASAMAAGGKKNEKIVRALSVAQAGIKAGSAAISAFEAGMSTGGPTAPLVAAKYAAASIAQTGIMISRLKSGSKQSKPSGTLPSNAGTISPEAAGAPQAGTQQRVDINISGQGFFSADQVRQLIEQINEQTSDGVQLNANVGA